LKVGSIFEKFFKKYKNKNGLGDVDQVRKTPDTMEEIDRISGVITVFNYRYL